MLASTAFQLSFLERGHRKQKIYDRYLGYRVLLVQRDYEILYKKSLLIIMQKCPVNVQIGYKVRVSLKVVLM